MSRTISSAISGTLALGAADNPLTITSQGSVSASPIDGIVLSGAHYRGRGHARAAARDRRSARQRARDRGNGIEPRHRVCLCGAGCRDQG
jgi:hypothetical protein